MKLIAVKELDFSMVWPDSAIIRSGKPVFLPEESDCFIHCGFGARISAVGKSIRPKFAPRYYTELFPVAYVLGRTASDALQKGECPLAKDIVTDYSVITGEPVEMIGQNTAEASLTSLATRELTDRLNISANFSVINNLIAIASERNTLKTGDIVASISSERMAARRDTLLRLMIEPEKYSIENKLK